MTKKELVREYIQKHRYFSLAQIVQDVNLDRKLVKDYLFQLKQENVVFDSGYGFFSTIAEKFPFMSIRRVEVIRQDLKKNYPLVDFLIWDTKIFASLYHHTQTHHITFVEVEKDLVFPIHEYLYGKYRGVLKERRVKSFFEEFDVTLDPVVVRAMPSRSPQEGNTPALEKILVDMYIDMDKYAYIGNSDYFELWRDLIRLYRINIRDLLSYGNRRKCLGSLYPQLTDNKNNYAIDFCHLIAKVGKKL